MTPTYPFFMDDESVGKISKVFATPKWAGKVGGNYHWRQLSRNHTRDLWKMLSSAKSSPARISVRAADASGKGKTDATLRLVLRTMSRVNEICLVAQEEHATGLMGAPDNAHFVVNQLASFAAPRLDTLYVENSRAEVVRFPDHLLQGQIPQRLEALYLRGCSISSKSILFRAPLTTLELENCTGLWHTYQEMKGTFRHLPELETLVLGGGVLPVALGIEATPPDDRVVLTNLLDVRLVGDVCQVMKVFHNLDFHPRAKLRITSYSHRQHSFRSALLPVLEYLRFHYAYFIKKRISFHTAHFEQGHDRSGRAILRAHHYSDAHNTSGSLVLTIEPMQQDNIYDGFLACLEIMANLGLFHGLQSLSVDHFALESDAAASQWGILGGTARRVNAMIVSGPAAYGLLDILPSCPFEPLFPHLSHLSIQWADFRKTSDGRAPFYDKLLHQLRHRSDIGGCGPYELDIQKCELEEHMVAGLRQFFNSPSRMPRRLHWDGRLNGISRKYPDYTLEELQYQPPPPELEDVAFDEWVSFD